VRSRSNDLLCLTIKKDAIVIDFPPQEVDKDCSLLKVYEKEFSQRPDPHMMIWNSKKENYHEPL